MQLPQDFPEIMHPTILLCTDHVQAHLWILGGHELQELDGVGLARERKSDHEASFVNTGTGAGSGPEPSDEERLSQYAKKLAEQLAELVKTHAIQRLLCAWPADLALIVKRHLSPETQELIKEHTGIFVHESPLDLARRFYS